MPTRQTFPTLCVNPPFGFSWTHIPLHRELNLSRALVWNLGWLKLLSQKLDVLLFCFLKSPLLKTGFQSKSFAIHAFLYPLGITDPCGRKYHAERKLSKSRVGVAPFPADDIAGGGR